MVDRLAARGAALAPPPGEWGSTDPVLVEQYRRWGLVWGHGPHNVRYSVAYDPEYFKLTCEELLAERGVRLYYHSWAVDVVREGDALTHVVLESKAGRGAIRARVVVDATGDGDIFAAAGEPYDLEQVHPWLWFRMGNVDVSRLDRRAPAFLALGEGRVLLPWGAAERLDRRIDGTDPDQLTYADVTCRRLVLDEADRLRREHPAFRQAYVADVAVTTDITESRRLRGRHVLERDDLDRAFLDSVAVTGHWTKYACVYAIPYRSLLPAGTANLLVAGRCIGVDHRVHHATKEIPSCMATGEAAGTAAAMAYATGRVGDVDVPALRHRLAACGAIVDLPPTAA